MTDLPSTDELRAALARVMPGVRADLERLVRIPSVSADAFDQGHVDASAEAVAELLRGAGLSDVRIVAEGGGRPAVIGARPVAAGGRSVLLYAHHDVQPPGDPADWDSPPFEPTERAGRLYGRGSADDKAGVMAHVAALRAWRELGVEPPVAVTVFVEGEEEIGSPSLADLLTAHGADLRADALVLADSSNWAVGRPALTTSLRGLADCVVEVSTLDHAVHSGMYGGPVPDALMALVRLLATLHDDAGDVAVPGLHAATAADLELSDERLREDAGVLDGVALVGSGSLTSRLWTRPSVTVIGIDAPSVAEASNTLRPLARAKVSLRVVPGQRAADAYAALRTHLQTHAPWGAHVRVIDGELAEPVALDAVGPAYDATRRAFAQAWGTEPVDIGIGGSIPFIAEFAAAFPEAAILVTGVEDPDGRAHGANESLHLGEFERACLAETLLLLHLAGA